MQELNQMVENKNPRAVLLARSIGPSANASLVGYTRNEDAKVRRIALNCLEETGGVEAQQAFLRLLEDLDPQVRSAALQGLIKTYDASLQREMIPAYDANTDPYIRQQIMLLLAQAKAPISEIQKRYKEEKDPTAREGSLVALAKLGDPEARKEFVNRLQSSQGRDRGKFLEYCQLIHESWLLKPLMPLLEDDSAMMRIGVDGRPDLTEYLRACDLVINLVAEISGKTFSFPVDQKTNYSASQISEVTQYLKSLPER